MSEPPVEKVPSRRHRSRTLLASRSWDLGCGRKPLPYSVREAQAPLEGVFGRGLEEAFLTCCRARRLALLPAQLRRCGSCLFDLRSHLVERRKIDVSCLGRMNQGCRRQEAGRQAGCRSQEAQGSSHEAGARQAGCNMCTMEAWRRVGRQEALLAGDGGGCQGGSRGEGRRAGGRNL